MDRQRREDKVVLFDWGGVVDSADFDNKYTYRRLYCEAIRRAFQLDDTYTNDMLWDYLNSHEYYRTSHDAPNKVIFEQMCRDIFKDLCKSNIHECVEKYIQYTWDLSSMVKYYPEIIFIEYRTHERCKTGIISDLSWLDGFRLRQQICLDNFDYNFLSYELGLSKRESDIFPYVNNVIGRSRVDVLFIDDVEENLLKAKQLGWQIYQPCECDEEGIKAAIDVFLES